MPGEYLMNFPLDDLTSSDWQTRRTAVERLLKQADPHTLEQLLRVLKERQDDLGLLNAALQVLQRNALPVIATLAELLRDEDTDTRIYAAQALGQFGHAAAVPLLLDALEDPDPNVRYHAIDSLGQLRAVQAVPALREYLQTPDFFLTFPAIEALAAIGDPSVLPDLLPLLDDAILSPAVVDALGSIGTPREIPHLLTWMAAPHADVLLGCRALVRLAERFPSPAGRVPGLVRTGMPPQTRQRLLQVAAGGAAQGIEDVITVLGWLEGRDVQRALVALLRNESSRPVAARALQGMGPQALPVVLESLPETEDSVRVHLVRILGSWGDARAVPALITLLGSGTASVVTEAAAALGKIGARESFDALLQQLRHPSGLVRRAVVAAINSLGHPEHTRRLLPLAQDPDPRVRAAVIDSLGYFAAPEAEKTILQALTDPTEIVQLAAVKALGVLDTPRAREALAEVAHSPSDRVRAAVMQAIALSEAGRPVLEAGLADSSPWVRLYACRGLAVLAPHPQSIARLLDVARNDSALHVRLTAIEALGTLGGASVQEPLQTLLDDPAADVREAALRALLRSAAPVNVPHLWNRLHAHPVEERLQFMRTLQEVQTSNSVQVLTALAWQDEAFEVRNAALSALKDMPPSLVSEALVVLAERSPDEIQVLNACLEMGLAILPPLLARLSQSDPAFRQRAVKLLQAWAMQSEEARKALLALSHDADTGVRMAVVRTLSLLASDDALDCLQRMAHEDPALEVRSAANRALLRVER